MVLLRTLRWRYDGAAVKRAGQANRVLSTIRPFSEFKDDFSINKVGMWNDFGSPGPVVSGGLLTIPATPEGPYRETRYPYIFEGNPVFIRLINRPNADFNTTAGFWVGPDSSNYMGFSLNGSTLTFQLRTNGVIDDTSLPYETGVNWWRLRMQSGVGYWETSADAMNWTIKRNRSITNASAYALAKARLFASASANAVNPGSAVFDYFNTLP